MTKNENFKVNDKIHNTKGEHNKPLIKGDENVT